MGKFGRSRRWGEGEGMDKLRHLLSSIQRRGVRAREWVSFVICCRRSIEGGCMSKFRHLLSSI